MREDDKQHIDAICRRNNIKYLTEEEARNYKRNMSQYAPDPETEHEEADDAEHGLISFSGRLRHEPSGKDVSKVIFVNPNELDNDGAERPDIDKDEHEYFVALHELGHMLLEHKGQQWESLDEQCAEECAAWRWAFDHAQYWPSDETICAALDACSTYTHLADNVERMTNKAKEGDYSMLPQAEVDEFKSLYHKALKNGQSEFRYSGTTFPIDFGKFVLDHIENNKPLSFPYKKAA